jgi:hypothetical protein
MGSEFTADRLGSKSSPGSCPSNVLPFSGERRTDARSYHGREEPRAPARGVAAQPALERAAQAFSRCNGLLDRATRSFRFISKIPSRVPRVRFLFPADEAVFEVPSTTPPIDEPAPPEPPNGRRRSRPDAATDLRRSYHLFATTAPNRPPLRSALAGSVVRAVRCPTFY